MLSPMTVVVQVNGIGQPVSYHSNLPIVIVELGTSNSSMGNIQRLCTLDEMTEFDQKRVLDAQTPWNHLSNEQKDTIDACVVSKFEHSDDSVLFQFAVSRIQEMPIDDKLELLGDVEDDSIAEILGFVPETGEPYVADEDEELEADEPTVIWGNQSRGSFVWHMFPDTLLPVPNLEATNTSAGRFVGRTACGITARVTAPVKLAKNTIPTVAFKQTVCSECKELACK